MHDVFCLDMVALVVDEPHPMALSEMCQSVLLKPYVRTSSLYARNKNGRPNPVPTWVATMEIFRHEVLVT